MRGSGTSSNKRIGYAIAWGDGDDPMRELEDANVVALLVDAAGDADVPQFKKVLNSLHEGDIVVVHRMDRMADRLEDLRERILRCTELGADVEFVKENIVFSVQTFASFGLLWLAGAFKEFEHAIIQRRRSEKAAFDRQRMAHRRVLSAAQIQEILRRARAGEEKSKLASEFNISRETLYKYLRKGGLRTSKI